MLAARPTYGTPYTPTAPAAGGLGVGAGWVRQSLANAVVRGAGLPVLAPRPAVGAGAGQSALQGTAEPLDTLETKRGSALDRIREARRTTHATARHLAGRGKSEAVLQRAAGRLRNCSVHGLFRSHDDGANHLIGRALCKCRLCPNCQEALSVKRKRNAEAFFAANAEQLKPFYFYHMVLTVRHSAADNVRTGLYTGDVVKYFAALRGQGGTNDRAAKAWWNDRVAGSLYSVELKAGRDGSPHIHVHALLLARRPLWRADGKPSAFVGAARDRWQRITGDSTGVFVEPVYTLDEAGAKQYYSPRTSGPDALRRAVAECAKYTLKTEPAALGAFSTAFIRDLLTTRNRYFGRTGILTKKGGGDMFTDLERLNTNFQDLEAAEERTAETMVNPETGAVARPEETRILMTPFANVQEVPAADGRSTYWALRDPTNAVRFGHELTPDVQVFLAQTLRRRYDPRADVGADPEEDPVHPDRGANDIPQGGGVTVETAAEE